MKSDEIARALKIELDETDAYIDGLKERGLVIWHHHEPGGGGWRRTDEGNRLAVAKRWAGEEGEPPKTYKYADLPPIQHEILLLIAAGESDGERETYIASKLEKTLGLIRYNLKQIEEADLAADPGLPDYGAGRCYYLRDKGAEYLAERDLL